MDSPKFHLSIVIDINEWAEVFPDPVIANATIDKMLYQSILLRFA